MLVRALALGGLLASSLPASAFQPGQWSWDSSVGFGQRGYDTEIDGRRLNDFRQQEVNLAVGVNGFIVHPAIAGFRLSADMSLTDVNGRREFDSDRLGLGANLNLIPYSAFPVRLFYQTSAYDYARPDDDPLTLIGAPDISTRWGGRMGVTRGPLAGIVAGFEQDSVDFLDPNADEQVLGRQYLNWSRQTRNFRHAVRVDRHAREYGTVDLEIDDVSARIDERATLTPTWRWEMHGSSLRRDLKAANGAESQTDIYRLRNRLLHDIGENDLLDMRVNLETTRFGGGGGDNENRGLSLYYRWRPGRSWEVAPFASYADQSAGDLSVTSPRVGTAVTWRRTAREVDMVLGGQTSYGRLEREDSLGVSDESQFGWGVHGSLAHGVVEDLRKELELEVSSDELRLTSDPVLGLPDLGLPRDGLGTEDLYRARVTLGHRWDGSQLNGWTEWLHRESEDVAAGSFESDNLSGTVQLTAHRVGLQGSVGDTTVRRETQEDQEVSFLGASAYWQPWRPLTVRVLYRDDTRAVSLSEDIDGKRYEAGAVFRFGRLLLDVYAYESRESLSGGTERTSRGFTWKLSTRFSGLLPVITGTKRRGVIR